jgi:hypothetical protein
MMLYNVLFINKYFYSNLIMRVRVVLLQLLYAHHTTEVLWNNVKCV